MDFIHILDLSLPHIPKADRFVVGKIRVFVDTHSTTFKFVSLSAVETDVVLSEYELWVYPCINADTGEYIEDTDLDTFMNFPWVSLELLNTLIQYLEDLSMIEFKKRITNWIVNKRKKEIFIPKGK